ncbi:MAG TPA: TIGR03435 family protein [Candidatus Limnocylindrales bacterium]|nr:TIGR03435 family protein [Candidatus Limnocylindrales bacterium]
MAHLWPTVTVRLSLFVLFVCSLFGQPLQQQTVAAPEWEKQAGGESHFEVASVKPSAPMTPFSTNVTLNGLDGPPPAGNRFSANAPLMAYLLFAYKINDSIQGRNIYDHLPEWARSQFFNIEARASRVPTRDQLRLMVQALLSDRFKLAIHREIQTREVAALYLVKAGTLGPYLKPHPLDQPCETKPDSSPQIEAPRNAADGPRYCGLVTWNIEGRRHLRMVDVTPEQIAKYLASASMVSNVPIGGVDRTGLTGRFDLDLEFTPEAEGTGSNMESAPPFKDAVKHQLGLRLVDQKAPAIVIFIDRLEKPSAN